MGQCDRTIVHLSIKHGATPGNLAKKMPSNIIKTNNKNSLVGPPNLCNYRLSLLNWIIFHKAWLFIAIFAPNLG